MSDQEAVQEDGAKGVGAISPIWALIGVIMIVALYTTIHGLYALTGSYVYAIPFGFVAQSILLIVSLNLGRDIARKATGRSRDSKVSTFAGTLRTLFLIAVYLLFFGICWFFAFSTYYNIFLARGDDVQTTASQAVQLTDQVLPALRGRAEAEIKKAATGLREGPLVTAFNTQLKGLQEAAGRPEVGTTIADAAYQAAQDAFKTRQTQRDRWRNELTELGQRQKTLKDEVEKKERESATRKAELEALPSRMRDLRRAIEEELTGVLPPPEGAAPPAPDAPPPGAPAPGTGATAPPGPTTGAPAPANPAAKGAPSPAQAGKAAPTPQQRLKPDGLASTLVKAQPCMIDRRPGRGEGGTSTCIFALETALKQAEARLKDLPQELNSIESALEGLRAAIDVLPKRIAELEQLQKDNPPLSAPPPRDPARSAGPDLTPLLKARQAFEAQPSEETFVALGDACRPIDTALRGLKPPPAVLSGFECRPESILAALKAHQRLADAYRAFSDQCGSAAVSDRTTAIVSRMRDDFARKTELRGDDAARRGRLGQTMDDVRKEVLDPCFTLATPLGVATDDLNKIARDFEDKTSPRQTDFSLASNAVVQVARLQATPPAYLGALFAAAQELAILLLSILRDINLNTRVGRRIGNGAAPGPLVNWGPDPTDPQVVTAAKTMLRAADGRRDGSLHLPAAFGDEEKPDIQANIQQLVRELKRDGHARPARFGGGTRILPDGVEVLEQRVKDYAATQRGEQHGAAAGSAPAAGAAADFPSSDQGARTAADNSEAYPAEVKTADAAEAAQGQKAPRKSGRKIGTRT